MKGRAFLVDFRNMTAQQLAEEALVDLAYAVLKDQRRSLNFEALMAELQKLKGLTNAELQTKLQQFYTDINIDGRFLLNQEDGWGLREWYKVEQIEEETAPSVKTRKKKSKAKEDDFDDVEELEAEEALEFDDELEDYEEDEEEDEKPVVEPIGFGKEDELEEEEIEEEAEIDEVLIEDEEFELDEEDEDLEEEDEEEYEKEK